MMKVGDKIIIKNDFKISRRAKGQLISCSLKTNHKKYMVKIDSTRHISIYLNESDCLIIPEQNYVSLEKDFFIERGSQATILEVLPSSNYLCKFERTLDCYIEFSEDEILLWSPDNKIFKLLENIEIAEDIPEYHLKKGMKGVIILVYFKPSFAYEIELNDSNIFQTYTLLPHQIKLV